jgi:hypothetical protein
VVGGFGDPLAAASPSVQCNWTANSVELVLVKFLQHCSAQYQTHLPPTSSVHHLTPSLPSSPLLRHHHHHHRHHQVQPSPVPSLSFFSVVAPGSLLSSPSHCFFLVFAFPSRIDPSPTLLLFQIANVFNCDLSALHSHNSITLHSSISTPFSLTNDDAPHSPSPIRVPPPPTKTTRHSSANNDTPSLHAAPSSWPTKSRATLRSRFLVRVSCPLPNHPSISLFPTFFSSNSDCYFASTIAVSSPATWTRRMALLRA